MRRIMIAAGIDPDADPGPNPDPGPGAGAGVGVAPEIEPTLEIEKSFVGLLFNFTV